MTGSFVGGGNQYIQLVSRFCTVNCQTMASNYQLSHLRLCREPNPDLRGGRRECYHSATVAPFSFGISLTQVINRHVSQVSLGYLYPLSHYTGGCLMVRSFTRRRNRLPGRPYCPSCSQYAWCKSQL